MLAHLAKEPGATVLGRKAKTKPIVFDVFSGGKSPSELGAIYNNRHNYPKGNMYIRSSS